MSDPEIILEQYKAYIADLGNFGARYASLHTLYFSLLGATIAVLGLTENGKLLGGPLSGPAVWIVALFGIGLCALWFFTANYYRAAFGAKFKVLRDLEEKLPGKPYTLETGYLGIHVAPADPSKTVVAKPRSWFERIMGHRPKILTAIEQLIPIAFLLLILALAFLAEKQPPPQAPAPAAAKKR
jgi:hypothetical protein